MTLTGMGRGVMVAMVVVSIKGLHTALTVVTILDLLLIKAEVIFKRSSNLYCRIAGFRRVLMVGIKVSKGFFV